MTKALYVHIPFCHDICGYCDFVRVGYNEQLVDRYLLELRKDLKKINEPVSSIYLGGGTPSALNLEQLELLFDSLSHLVNEGIEYTIEVNPDSLNQEKAQLFVKAGINRVSLGVQSTQDEMLKNIGRTHTFEDVRGSINILRSVGLTNISMDLIYGLPHQTIHDVSLDVDHLIELNPPHISLYSLTIEPHSQFARDKIEPAPTELEAQMYQLIHQKLTRSGYEHYEISNYCKIGYESSHNCAYWNYHDFIGVGIGAAGKENNIRYTNHNNINDYILGHRKFSERVELSNEDKRFEHLMMSLRLKKGLHIETFNRTHNSDLLLDYSKQIQHFCDENLLMIEDGTLRASESGRLVLHDILVEFL